MIIADGIESNDSDKDLYQPENTDLMQMDSDEDEVEVEDDDESDGEVENEDGCENKEVVSKKGKMAKSKPGHCQIAAIRTTVPTTGSKSAVEHSKHHEQSPRSVSWNPYIYSMH